MTILRPTSIFSALAPNPSFVGRWVANLRFFGRQAVIIDEGRGRIQPISSNDVAGAAYNALKIPESIGQSYDLGGPVVYTYRELYEFLFNLANMDPYMISIPMHKAFEYYNAPIISSPVVLSSFD